MKRSAEAPGRDGEQQRVLDAALSPLLPEAGSECHFPHGSGPRCLQPGLSS